MKVVGTRMRSWLLGMSVAALCLLQPGLLWAKKSHTVRQWTYKRLQSAHELIEGEQYKQALSVLDGAEQRRKLNDHERALLTQTTGFIYSALEDYDQAIASFERCLKFDALPDVTQRNTEYNLAQIYVAAGRYKQATAFLEAWIGAGATPSAEAHYLLAGAYAELERSERALVHAKRAVELTNMPRESWLSLLMALHFEKKQFRDVLVVLKQLLERYPKKAYWSQLAPVYGELGDEPRMLAALQLAYEQGYLTKSQELVGLGQLLLSHGLPYQAAKLLGREFEKTRIEIKENNLRVLGSAWVQARELDRAEKPLAEAAALSEDGELYLQLAQIHIDQEEWRSAISAIKHALVKGGLKEPGHAYLMQAMSYYSLGEKASAVRVFTLAKGYEKSRKSAMQWLKHMDATSRDSSSEVL